VLVSSFEFDVDLMIYSFLMSGRAVIAGCAVRIEHVIRVRFDVSSKSKARVIVSGFSSFILVQLHFCCRCLYSWLLL
jgi:hypothetical protein